MRHREAAERTLLTAVAAGASPAALADLLLTAETDRAFADERTLARLHQQGLRVPRPDRLGACQRRAADRGRPDGGSSRRRRDRPLGASRSISSPCARKLAAELPGPVRRRSKRGPLVRSCGARPARSSATTRWRSWMALRRRSEQALLLPTLAAPSPMRRHSGWLASAAPTSTPIGRRPTTSSPMPTPSTRC